ncbi:LysM peptidoglycan-binding domain-containing protein, partial [Pseudomonas chlororaphis]|nr:LysM peptidoglycan-binding domain-containing protein [Pseudomonas chlororaphis]
MGDTTNSQDQASATEKVSNFGSNLSAQLWFGKDGVSNAVLDTYGVVTSALYSWFATAAGEAGKIPGPVGLIGTTVNVVVSSATGTDIECSVKGATEGAAIGIAAAAAAAVITEIPSAGLATAVEPIITSATNIFFGTAAQKIITASCLTDKGYIDGKLSTPIPIPTPITPDQATSEQAFQDTLTDSPLPQAPASTSQPLQASTSNLAAQIIQFRPSPDYTGADGVYTVQSGQTLTSIAAANGVSVKELEETNPQIVYPDSIRTGQVIQLPQSATGYVPGATNSSTDTIPDDAAQTGALTNALQQSAGTDISVVAENSGRIALLSTTTGQATIIANDGTVTTESLDSYNQQAQITYDNYVANGYLNSNSQVDYADYQSNVYGVLGADGQTGTVDTSAGVITQDAQGDIAVQTAAGQLYFYDQANGESLFASDSGPNSELVADVQSSGTASGIIDDSKAFTTDGNVQYEDSVSTTSTGQATATYTGQGGVIDLSDATVNLSAGSSATLSGSNNNITGGIGDTVTTQGTNENVTLGTSSTLDVQNGSVTVNLSGSTVIVGAGSEATLTGSSDTVTDGANTTLSLTGVSNNDTVTMSAGDTVSIASSDQGEMIYASGDAVSLGSNTTSTLIGNNDQVSGGTGNTVSVVGNDTVQGASDLLYLGGNETVSTSGSGMTVETNANDVVVGSGDTVNVGGNLAAGQSAGVTTLVGSNDLVDATGDTLSVQGNDTVQGTSDLLYLGGNETVSTSGSGMTVETNANDVVVGSGDTVNVGGNLAAGQSAGVTTLVGS